MASQKPYDTRREAAPGEPRSAHFNDAVHQATFAAAIKSHKHQNDDTTFPDEPYDE